MRHRGGGGEDGARGGRRRRERNERDPRRRTATARSARRKIDHSAASPKSPRPERTTRPERAPRTERPDPGTMTRIYIGAGRAAGVRPGDLVGAIAGEAGVDSKVIGSIEIDERFSIVEVQKDLAENIIAALRHATIRGRKVAVNRDRGPKS